MPRRQPRTCRMGEAARQAWHKPRASTKLPTGGNPALAQWDRPQADLANEVCFVPRREAAQLPQGIGLQWLEAPAPGPPGFRIVMRRSNPRDPRCQSESLDSKNVSVQMCGKAQSFAGSPGPGRLQVFACIEGAPPAGGKVAFRVEPAEDLDELCDGASPTCLVACAQARAVVAIEVLEEEKVVPPMGIGLELLRGAVDGTPAGLVAQENAGQPGGDFAGDFEQVHPNTGAGGTLDLEIVAIVKIERQAGRGSKVH